MQTARLRSKEASDFPIGSIVLTPMNHRAQVIGYRGRTGKNTRIRADRPHRTWLVLMYVERITARGRAFDQFCLLPELVRLEAGPMDMREAA